MAPTAVVVFGEGPEASSGEEATIKDESAHSDWVKTLVATHQSVVNENYT